MTARVVATLSARMSARLASAALTASATPTSGISPKAAPRSAVPPADTVVVAPGTVVLALAALVRTPVIAPVAIAPLR